MAKIITDSVFNGPVEFGLRSLVLLTEAYPRSLDLQRIVTLDHFLVHSGDMAGGPESLHPAVPLRSGEPAIRRGLIEDGLKLYRFRGLVELVPTLEGFNYTADDSAASFLDALSSTYVRMLRERAEWVVANYAFITISELNEVIEDSLGRWETEFELLSGLEDVG